MQIYLPALPDVAASFQVGSELTQLTFSVFMLSMGISQLFVGTVSDRFGRRPLMLIGIFVFVLGSIACALAATIEQLIAARAVQAAGGGAGLVLARAVLSDLYPPQEMARRFAFVILIMLIGPTLGPLLGGYVAELAGWRIIFWILAAAGVIVFALLLARLPETLKPHSGASRPSLLKGIGKALRHKRFLLYGTVSTFSISSYYVFISAAPFLMVGMFDTSAKTFGQYFILLALAYGSGNFAATRLTVELGIKRTVFSGLTIALVGAVALAGLAYAGVWHPLALFGPMMIITFAHGFSGPSTQSGGIAQLPESAGSASSLISFTMQFAGAGFAQLVSAAPVDTPVPLASIMLALVTIAYLAALRVYRTGSPGLA